VLKDRRNAKLKVLKMSLQGLTDYGSSSRTPAKKIKNAPRERFLFFLLREGNARTHFRLGLEQRSGTQASLLGSELAPRQNFLTKKF
jgi:hypothetical protein